MGNRSSSAKQSVGTTASASGVVDPSNDNGIEEVAADTSGVFLSQDLQKKVIHDFQSVVLKEEWEKRQKSILAQNNKRVMAAEKRKADLEQKLEAWRNHDKKLHEKLDTKIDELNSRFADSAVELKYDTDRLEKKIGQGPKFGTGNACLNARADLANCYKNSADPLACDEFIEALERCVKKTVLSQ